MTRLQHEMERMADDTDSIEELEKEVERLRAALRPFADAAKRLRHMSDEGAALVSVADLRAASRALEAT